jgi:glutaredoxin 3
MSVTVYSTPSCPYCTMAKNYLKQKEIPFEEFDVSQDQPRAEEMVRKSRQMGVPVLDVNGTIIVGFSPKDIEVALAS